MDLSRLRCHSLDDEECYGFRNSCNLSLNSDSEYSGSVSVRDMIRHYDSQAKTTPGSTDSLSCKGWPKRPHSHHILCDNKSSQCDRHILETRNNAHQLVYHSNAYDQKIGNCCKNCTTCRCCQNRSRKSSFAIKSIPNNESLANLNAKDVVAQNQMKTKDAASAAAGVGADVSCGCGCLEFKNDSATESCTQLKIQNTGDKNHLQTTDSTEEANCHPIETSYESKTTIAKTASGVRIIIDIYFDQELQCVNTSNVLGSRVETNIPQSRILSEFQQQTRAVSATSLK